MKFQIVKLELSSQCNFLYFVGLFEVSLLVIISASVCPKIFADNENEQGCQPYLFGCLHCLEIATKLMYVYVVPDFADKTFIQIRKGKHSREPSSQLSRT